MKKQTKKLTCLCCQKEVEDQAIQQTLGRLVESWGGLIPVKREYLERGFYQWACDTCLENGRAIKAHFEEQVFCDFNPHLAYYDMPKACETCKESYVFEAKEQQFWYETLKFWVQSEPKHCPACRKDRRNKRALNKELSELLRDKSNLSLESLERLVEIYEKMGKEDRVQYFRAKIRKLKV